MTLRTSESRHDKSLTFYCFSPAVMAATFTIEFLLLIYTFIRYRMTEFGRLVMLTLFCLGTFQLAEFQICANSVPEFWSRVGFIVITLLPPLGIHLISLITGRRHYIVFSYTLAFLFGTIFLFAPYAITGAVCGGNYIIFNTAQPLAWTYGMYYFGFLFLGIWEALEDIKGASRQDFPLRLWMIAGYLSFMVPMDIVYFMVPAARAAIPSIMCGFALTFAFLLGFVIVPRFHRVRQLKGVR
ncbi:MAG: hypothetical protein KGI60_01650 [Patescibacteria group bacterium]|nr:hypothetical protein [Patescibacteria group bacterium]